METVNHLTEVFLRTTQNYLSQNSHSIIINQDRRPPLDTDTISPYYKTTTQPQPDSKQI